MSTITRFQRVSKKLRDLGLSDEERLLIERKRRRLQLRNHAIIFVLINAGDFVVCGMALPTFNPALVLIAIWTVALAGHFFVHKRWMRAQEEALAEAEQIVLASGKEGAAHLVDSSHKPPPRSTVSLMTLSKEAFSSLQKQAEARGVKELEPLRTAMAEAEAACKEILETHRSLMEAVEIAQPDSIAQERSRVADKMHKTTSSDLRKLYASELKLTTLEGQSLEAIQSLVGRINAEFRTFVIAVKRLSRAIEQEGDASEGVTELSPTVKGAMENLRAKTETILALQLEILPYLKGEERA